MWRVLRKRIILGAPVIFCFFVAFDWKRAVHAGFASDWVTVLFAVGVNIVWTVFFVAVSLLLLKPLAKRINARDHGLQPREGTDRTNRVDRDAGSG